MDIARPKHLMGYLVITLSPLSGAPGPHAAWRTAHAARARAADGAREGGERVPRRDGTPAAGTQVYIVAPPPRIYGYR